jgi:hypothetical protein
MYPEHRIERRNPPKEGSTPICPNMYTIGEDIKPRFYCRLTDNLCIGNPTDPELEGLVSYTKINRCLKNTNRK